MTVYLSSHLVTAEIFMRHASVSGFNKLVMLSSVRYQWLISYGVNAWLAEKPRILVIHFGKARLHRPMAPHHEIRTAKSVVAVGGGPAWPGK